MAAPPPPTTPTTVTSAATATAATSMSITATTTTTTKSTTKFSLRYYNERNMVLLNLFHRCHTRTYEGVLISP